MNRREEIEAKHERVRQFLRARHLEGVLLCTHHNFSWFTAGAHNHVVVATESGVAQVLVTASDRILFTNNIEHPRILAEEGIGDLVQWETFPWYDPREQSHVLRKHTAGKRIATDGGHPGMTPLPPEFDELRHTLLPPEIGRYRGVCHDSGVLLAEVARSVQPGETELSVAGRVSDACYRLGLIPAVVLVAADDRILRVRHPIPTSSTVKKHVMIVLCARRNGLVSAVTRIVHFGKLADDLRRRHDAVMKVDAAAILASRPGRHAGEVFDDIRAAYADTGFPEEWKMHHQGGLISYRPREWVANPGAPQVILRDQAFAWNPSIAGTKSEDTVLITEFGPEVITTSPDWPVTEIRIGDRALPRPEILVR